MKLKTIILWSLFGLFQLTSCQNYEKKQFMSIYNVEISHPENKYLITPIEDSILTLENTGASLPYGSSSGSWGQSGKIFTERTGTPVGADIIYFSRYENVFYHLKAKFPVDIMKDMVQRAYAVNESQSSDKTLKEYININENLNYVKEYNEMVMSYYPMTDLVFGFAPEGMVVVWLRYGLVQKEIGTYKAEIINQDQKYAEKLFSKISQTRENIKSNMYLPNASPKQWDAYRNRYPWTLKISSENKAFRLMQVISTYYNAETEIMLRPWVENIPIIERSVPEEIGFYWETGKGEAFEGRAFFNWKKTEEAFKKAGKNFKLELKIAHDNSSYQVLLNNQPLEIDSMRIYGSNKKYKDSYR